MDANKRRMRGTTTTCPQEAHINQSIHGQSSIWVYDVQGPGDHAKQSLELFTTMQESIRQTSQILGQPATPCMANHLHWCPTKKQFQIAEQTIFPWNIGICQWSPTRSKDVNDLIKAVKKKGVWKQGTSHLTQNVDWIWLKWSKSWICWESFPEENALMQCTLVRHL